MSGVVISPSAAGRSSSSERVVNDTMTDDKQIIGDDDVDMNEDVVTEDKKMFNGKTKKRKASPPADVRRSSRARNSVTQYQPRITPEISRKISVTMGDNDELGSVSGFSEAFQKIKSDDDACVALHRVLYKTTGTKTHRKRDIRNWKGVSTDNNAERNRIETSIKKLSGQIFKNIGRLLGVKQRQKESMVDDIVGILTRPDASVSKSSGKTSVKKTNKKSTSDEDDGADSEQEEEDEEEEDQHSEEEHQQPEKEKPKSSAPKKRRVSEESVKKGAKGVRKDVTENSGSKENEKNNKEEAKKDIKIDDNTNGETMEEERTINDSKIDYDGETVDDVKEDTVVVAEEEESSTGDNDNGENKDESKQMDVDKNDNESAKDDENDKKRINEDVVEADEHKDISKNREEGNANNENEKSTNADKRDKDADTRNDNNENNSSSSSGKDSSDISDKCETIENDRSDGNAAGSEESDNLCESSTKEENKSNTVDKRDERGNKDEDKQTIETEESSKSSSKGLDCAVTDDSSGGSSDGCEDAPCTNTSQSTKADDTVEGLETPPFAVDGNDCSPDKLSDIVSAEYACSNTA